MALEVEKLELVGLMGQILEGLEELLVQLMELGAEALELEEGVLPPKLVELEAQ